MIYIINAVELCHLQTRRIEAKSKEDAIEKYIDMVKIGDVMVNNSDIMDFNIEELKTGGRYENKK